MTSARGRALGVVVGVAASALAAPARADAPPSTAIAGAASAPPPGPRTAPLPPTWDPAWRRSSTADYVVTSISLAGALGSLAIPKSTTRWTSVDGLDQSVHDALEIKSLSWRENARDFSDALLTLSFNQLAVDSLVVAWWGYDDRDLAWQLASIDAEAMALDAFVQGLTSGLTSRERPYSKDECGDPRFSQTADCVGSNRYRSFFSGHTSTTFTAAGLTCEHHAHLPLYGGGAGDALACVGALAAAGATGYLRMAADMHYFTDVMTGAAVGSLIGFGAPWLFHYRRRGLPLAGALPGGGFYALVPAQGGVGVMGAF
jgi:hypothetical protein